MLPSLVTLLLLFLNLPLLSFSYGPSSSTPKKSSSPPTSFLSKLPTTPFTLPPLSPTSSSHYVIPISHCLTTKRHLNNLSTTTSLERLAYLPLPLSKPNLYPLPGLTISENEDRVIKSITISYLSKSQDIIEKTYNLKPTYTDINLLSPGVQKELLSSLNYFIEGIPFSSTLPIYLSRIDFTGHDETFIEKLPPWVEGTPNSEMINKWYGDGKECGRVYNSDGIVIDVFNSLLYLRVNPPNDLNEVYDNFGLKEWRGNVFGVEGVKNREGKESYQMFKGDEGEMICEENGINYNLRFGDGFSTGLFLDTSNLRKYVGGLEGRTLNLFSHANAISIASSSSRGGVNVDLSSKDFDLGVKDDWKNIEDDVWEYCKRKKGKEIFEVVVCDPPSSSVGKKRRWSTIKDYPELITHLSPLTSSNGLLILCSNTKKQTYDEFYKQCKKGLEISGRKGEVEKVIGTEWGWWREGVKCLVWRLD